MISRKEIRAEKARVGMLHLHYLVSSYCSCVTHRMPLLSTSSTLMQNSCLRRRVLDGPTLQPRLRPLLRDPLRIIVRTHRIQPTTHAGVAKPAQLCTRNFIFARLVRLKPCKD